MTIRIDPSNSWVGTLPCGVNKSYPKRDLTHKETPRAESLQDIVKTMREFGIVDIWANVYPLKMILISSFGVVKDATDNDLIKKWRAAKTTITKYVKKRGWPKRTIGALSVTNGVFRRATLHQWLQTGAHLVNNVPVQEITVINLAETDGAVLKPSWHYRQRLDDAVPDLNELFFFCAGYNDKHDQGIIIEE